MTGSEFKRRRQHLNITQIELAKRWNISRETVINIEKRETVQGYWADALAAIERERS